MEDSYFVIFNKRGIDRFCKTDGFTLKSGERAVRMVIEVPDEVFAPASIPTTTVRIPYEAVARQIEVETVIGEEQEP